jgi:transcriptional regulator with XRE-family HTH domain
MTDLYPISRDLFRSALARAGLTQRGAARALGINERTVRRYAAGEPVPTVVWIALRALATR